MKKIFSLLLMLLFMIASVDLAQARDVKPKSKHFIHNSGSQGKHSKARFRREAKPSTIDLSFGKLEKFKTARANPNYKFAKGS